MSRVVTRRSLLATGLVLVGGATGTALGLTRPVPVPVPRVPPQALTDAVERERRLIAGLDAALAAGTADARLTAIRADHAAHLDALQAAVQDLVRPTAAPTPPAPPVVPALPIAALAAAERAAAQAGAAGSAQLTGDVAVVLASVAACEATHAQLLS